MVIHHGPELAKKQEKTDCYSHFTSEKTSLKYVELLFLTTKPDTFLGHQVQVTGQVPSQLAAGGTTEPLICETCNTHNPSTRGDARQPPSQEGTGPPLFSVRGQTMLKGRCPADPQRLTHNGGQLKEAPHIAVSCPLASACHQVALLSRRGPDSHLCHVGARAHCFCQSSLPLPALP